MELFSIRIQRTFQLVSTAQHLFTVKPSPLYYPQNEYGTQKGHVI